MPNEVGLVCPRCGAPTTFYKLPVFACPRCQEPYPQNIRESAESSLMIQKAERPLLLTIGMYVSPGIGGLMLAGLLLAMVGGAETTINGEIVSSGEFFRHAGVQFLVTGILLLVIGYGLYRQESWSRWVMAFYWIVVLAMQTASGWANSGAPGAAMGAAGLLLPLLVAGWYLFLKDNVVEYFAGLERYEKAVEGRR